MVIGLVLFMIAYSDFAQSGVAPALGVPATALAAALVVFVLLRFGILGLAGTLTTMHLVERCVVTCDFSRWYVWPAVVALVLLAALVVHAFRAALAGRPVFGRALLEE